jgi:hypothetical protein
VGGDDLKFVVSGDVDDLGHGAVNNLTHGLAKSGGVVFSMVDANERHAVLSEAVLT